MNCINCTHCDIKEMRCRPEAEGFEKEYKLGVEDLIDNSECDFYDEQSPDLVKMVQDLNGRLSQGCIGLSQLHSKLRAVESATGCIELIKTLKNYISITDMIREEIMKQIGEIK